MFIYRAKLLFVLVKNKKLRYLCENRDIKSKYIKISWENKYVIMYNQYELGDINCLKT